MMKLDDALLGVSALGFDTSPFIYFVEQHSAAFDLMREIFSRVDVGALTGYSSVITLTEVLTLPKRLQQTKLANDYRDLLLNSRNFNLIPINATIAEMAADLRARYNLRTPDALQIAAALSAGCAAFLTNDLALQRVKELRVLALSQMQL
ncbi:MAG TPA: PIN domain-containing protein [Pyrinomonadaceae bacterium]|jgi:predicted nucleic acid-binding protein